MRKRIEGFTLLEMTIVLGLAMVIMAAGFREKFEDLRDARARELGNRIAQYNQAVGAHLSDLGLGVPPGNFAGTGWLKDSDTCPAGTGTTAYLPCPFPDVLPFGLSVQTAVTNGGGVVAADTIVGPAPLAIAGRTRGDLAGLAVLTARGAAAASQQAAAANLAAMLDYRINGVGQIEARVDMAASADPWLRLDGTNSMQADLDVGGNRVVDTTGLEWGDAMMHDDQGGVIELGGNNSTPGAGTPYIDFHGHGLTEDFNARIINDANGRLTVEAPDGVVTDDLFARIKGRWLSQAVQDVQVLADGETMPKSTCPGGMAPQVFVVPQIFAAGATGEPMGAVQAWAEDAGANWRARLRVLTRSGWQTPDPDHGRVIALTKCT